MECMTAVVFCVLLSQAFSMDSQNDAPCESNTNDASTSGGTASLEEREHFLKVQSAKSYVSFMIGDELICGGVLYRLDGAIAAQACGQKLENRGLGNVETVIGLSRRGNTPPVYIYKTTTLTRTPGLCFVNFLRPVVESNFIRKSPAASLESTRRFLPYDYLVTWSTAQNDYVFEDVPDSSRIGEFAHCHLPQGFAVPSPNEYENYIIFRDGSILGCSFDIAYENPRTQRREEASIMYAPLHRA